MACKKASQKEKALKKEKDKKKSISKIQKNIKIELPRKLSLFSGRKKTIAFLETFHRQIKSNEGRGHYFELDFSKLEFINPTTALVFASELDFWRSTLKTRLFVKKEQWNKQPLSLFSKLGLFDLLNVASPLKGERENKNELIFKFRTGARLQGRESNNEKQAMDLEDALIEQIGNFPGQDNLYAGLTEAMNNVSSHAYPESKEYENFPYIRKRWWMTGSYAFKERKLTIIFYDQGVGIPKTVKSLVGANKIENFFRHFGSKDSDGARIKVAVEYGKTATGLRERGKGLKDILRVADRAGNATLRILSGYGQYKYSPSEKEHILNFRTFLKGTLIQWEIDVPTSEKE
ncbi:hypothetical protein ACQZV8_07075 [Magnetococcales bacterium HHB-1]